MKTIILAVVTAFLIGPIAYASKGGGGGVWSEGDLKHMLARLELYLSSSEGQTLFPEVVNFDKSHPDGTFSTILRRLNPHLVDHRVFDHFGNERDCVSESSNELGLYFECNIENLPAKPEGKSSSLDGGEYYGSMYRLVLHEAFVQTGLEQPVAKELPSVYPLAARLMVHLESFPEWMPGGDNSRSNMAWATTPMKGNFILARSVKTSPIRMRYTQAFPEKLMAVSFEIKPCSQDFRNFVEIGDRLADGTDHYRVGVIIYDSGEKCDGPVIRETKTYGIRGSYGPDQINDNTDVQPFKLLSETTVDERKGHEDFYLAEVSLAAPVKAPKNDTVNMVAAFSIQPCSQRFERFLVADGDGFTKPTWSGSMTSRGEETHIPEGSSPDYFIVGNQIRIGAIVRDSGQECVGTTERKIEVFSFTQTNLDFWLPAMTFQPLIRYSARP